MARRGFFRRIKDAFNAFIGKGQTYPSEESHSNIENENYSVSIPQELREHGIFGPIAPPAPTEDEILAYHGPYPERWGIEERRFWADNPGTIHEYWESETEWRKSQKLFERGWLIVDRREVQPSPDERKVAREQWSELSGVPLSIFNWNGYREYLEAIGSPSTRK